MWLTPSRIGLLAGCPDARGLVRAAFVVLPAAVALVAVAFGAELGSPMLAAYLAQLAILPLVNLWEETAVMGVILVLAVLLRFVAGWLYAGTGGSILLAAGLHATFNAANGSGPPLAATAAVVAVWALALLAGRAHLRLR